MESGASNEVIIAIIGLAGTVIAGLISYRAGYIKTRTEEGGMKRDDSRDDFSIITDKYADIITTLERQTQKQQRQIERQDEQIDKLIRERNALKRQVELLVEEIRQLKTSLEKFPDIDEKFITHIEELHDRIVNNENAD